MLLVAGGDSDPNLGRLLERAGHRGCPILPLLVGSGCHPSVCWDLQADRLEIEGREIRPQAVFLRHDVFTHLAEGRPETSFRALAWFSTILGWAQAHGVRMLNAASIGTVIGKPLQLSLASRAGLLVPETLITNDLGHLQGVATGAARIAKPVNGGGYAQPLESLLESTERRHGRAAAPAIVQERLEPPEVRIFAVGRRLFAFRVVSDALDYRTSRRTRVEPLPISEVPRDLKAGLRRLLEGLSMTFGAADFKSCPQSGRLRFLEINSSPMFVAFDRAADGAICDAMLRFLTRPAPREAAQDTSSS